MNAGLANGRPHEYAGTRAVGSRVVLLGQGPQDRAVCGSAVSRAGRNERRESVAHALESGDTRLHIQQLRLSRTLDAPDSALRREGDKFLDSLQGETTRFPAP